MRMMVFASLVMCLSACSSVPSAVDAAARDLAPASVSDLARIDDLAQPATADLAGSAAKDMPAAPSDAAGTTWTSFAQQFCATYCVSCHGPMTADQKRDYSRYADVTRDAQLEACGVSSVAVNGNCFGIVPRQFPVGNGAKPSDPERKRFTDWLNAGAPL